MTWVATILAIFTATAHAKILFFGGVTDPGLYQGQYPWSWPDTEFTALCLYSQASCQDSCSSYQQVDGNDPGYTAVTEWMAWVNQNAFYTTWYGGYIASEDWAFAGPSDLTAYVQAMATLPGMQGANIYINFANEPMHATGLAANNQSSTFIAAMGGTGKTGYDWLINIGKIFRRYFPHAKLGINDFSWESVANDLPAGYGDGSITYLSTMMNIVKILKSAGVIDWVGGEGYGLESVASVNLTSAINQMGALGVGVIFTEFTPGAYEPSYVASANLSYWQRLLPLFATNQHVIGVIGPWTYRRSDTIGNGWLVDDTVSPMVVEPAESWIKTYISQYVWMPHQRVWVANYTAWLKTLNTTEHPNALKVLPWISAHPTTSYTSGQAWYAALIAYENSLCAGKLSTIGVYEDYIPSHPFPTF